MTTDSLLEGCNRCLQKGHESWKSYFSKWEVLAKDEEGIPESELIEYEDVEFSTPEKKKLTRRKNEEENKRKNKTIGRKKKGNIKKKVSSKCKKKIIERPNLVNNESLPEDSDNKELEMDLRRIFMDILRGNKNKWEIFSVLSQTFSHEEVTIKSSTSLLNDQHLALSSNDFKVNGINLSNQQVFPFDNFPRRYVSQSGSFNFIRFSENSRLKLENGVDLLEWGGGEFGRNVTSFGVQSVTNVGHTPQKLFPHRFETPQTKFSFNLGSRISQTCPGKIFNTSLTHHGSKTVKALDFTNGMMNDRIIHSLQHSQINLSRRESFQRLFLHKRTNDVSVNMENSNFLTPKRKPLERKCFSEKQQRKKRRPSKLSFLDYKEDESDSDDPSENHSPVIVWECKKQKIESSSTVAVAEESDFDESESIFDTPKGKKM